MEKLLKRINELAKIAKERQLSEEELIERQELRQKYLKLFREGFKQQLENTRFVDENNNDITEQVKAQVRKKRQQKLN